MSLHLSKYCNELEKKSMKLQKHNNILNDDFSPCLKHPLLLL